MKIRVNKIIKFISIIVLLNANIFLSVESVKAEKTKLVQKIFSVRLVYFDKKGNLKKIKDVKASDESILVVKFYNYKNNLITKKNTEAHKWDKYWKKYYQEIKKEKEKQQGDESVSVNFIKKKGIVEEIYTCV